MAQTRGGKRDGAGPKTKDPSGKAQAFTVRLSPAHLADLEYLMGYYGGGFLPLRTRSETVAHALKVSADRLRAAERQDWETQTLHDKGL